MAFLSTNSIFFFFIIFLIPLSSSSSPSDEVPQNFIVYVTKSEKPSLFASHHHWYTSIIESLPSSKLLYSYDHVIDGFAASLTPTQADKLRHLSGILAVVPDQVHQLHTTYSPNFLGLSLASGIWTNSSFGSEVIIGVLDTGIYPGHVSFSDLGLSPVPSSWKGGCEVSKDFPASACNRKLIGARAFYKGYEASLQKPINESIESKSPRDTDGHGTHCGSTAAGALVSGAGFSNYALGIASGTAIMARVAAYKVCWLGGCLDSDILEAMEKAIADGVHVISLSVGPSAISGISYISALSVGSFRVVQRGIVVSSSAGNIGPDSYTVGNVSPWMLTVGASTTDRDFPTTVHLGNGITITGVSLYAGDPLPGYQISLIYGGNAGDQYCIRTIKSLVTGKIVVCKYSGYNEVSIGNQVSNAGGVGMIMVNSKVNSGEQLNARAYLLPAITVSQADGDIIINYVTKNPGYATATIVFHGTVFKTAPAPKVALFSSRGPNRLTPEILKPDVIAPGVNILAAWTGDKSPTKLDYDTRRVLYNIISGTSMACPHVSGIAALLRKVYPNWSPAAIKSAIMTTAYNLDNYGQYIQDLGTGTVSTPFTRGAGHVNPNTALNPGLVYDMNVDDYVAFLCSIGYDYRTIALFLDQSTSKDICAKTVATTGTFSTPGDLNYPGFAVVFGPRKKTVIYKRVVTNVGSQSDVVYTVSVAAPPGIQIKVVPNRLVFRARQPTQAYNVTITDVGISSGVTDAFGWIEWTDKTHRVRSPVAIKINSTKVSVASM